MGAGQGEKPSSREKRLTILNGGAKTWTGLEEKFSPEKAEKSKETAPRTKRNGIKRIDSR